ncbi:hypothetical protein EUGRSUZ_F02417 [Eucalyptus grandis]|uniref:Uncharacterized protein n=2 Tax=Eucalyptus grandis TaxID=71139 RepID=A0ACC3KHY0_EUCGR|nr:hypothetical protein EUGRSUZ_F02417 [Eucalyptus grandis]
MKRRKESPRQSRQKDERRREKGPQLYFWNEVVKSICCSSKSLSLILGNSAPNPHSLLTNSSPSFVVVSPFPASVIHELDAHCPRASSSMSMSFKSFNATFHSCAHFLLQCRSAGGIWWIH